MSRVITAGALIPGTADTPLDDRTRVATLADIADVEMPFVGMEIYCVATAKKYRVVSLKNKTVNGVVVANLAVDEYVELSDRPSVAGCASLDDVRSIRYPYVGMCFYVSGGAEQGAYMVTETEQIVENDAIRTVIAAYTPLYLAHGGTSGGGSGDGGNSGGGTAAAATMYYGYVADGATDYVTKLTAAHLAQATVHTATGAVSRAPLSVPAGALVFALIPQSAPYTAKKDDGFGGKVAFDEDNAVSVTVNGVTYRGWGEYSVVDADMYIYIE